MSEERYCVVCHEVVWFGAYGVCKAHVKTPHEGTLVCTECIYALQKLVVIPKEDQK
jgi:hypothetical protein